MGRLIDANRLLKGKTDHDMISTHLIYNAPTVDAIPREYIEQMVAEIQDVYIGYRHGYEVMHDVMQIIHKYTKEQTE